MLFATLTKSNINYIDIFYYNGVILNSFFFRLFIKMVVKGKIKINYKMVMIKVIFGPRYYCFI